MSASRHSLIVHGLVFSMTWAVQVSAPLPKGFELIESLRMPAVAIFLLKHHLSEADDEVENAMASRAEAVIDTFLHT